MAYSGFISSPEYTRKNIDEKITGEWIFENEITFKKVIKGTALATYYGDLAEYYKQSSNEIIPCGSLIKFGGYEEITKTQKNDYNFFGVISSDPAIQLNTKPSENNYLPVALCGRVPCRVKGIIKKFDKLTTSKIPGVAKKKTLLDNILMKPTIGIALENKTNKKEKLIEIFIQSKL